MSDRSYYGMIEDTVEEQRARDEATRRWAEEERMAHSPSPDAVDTFKWTALVAVLLANFVMISYSSITKNDPTTLISILFIPILVISYGGVKAVKFVRKEYFGKEIL
jgi:hypothetical protein